MCGSQNIDQDKLERKTHLGLSLDVNILSLSEEVAGIFTLYFRKRTKTTYLAYGPYLFRTQRNTYWCNSL